MQSVAAERWCCILMYSVPPARLHECSEPVKQRILALNYPKKSSQKTTKADRAGLHALEFLSFGTKRPQVHGKLSILATQGLNAGHVPLNRVAPRTCSLVLIGWKCVKRHHIQRLVPRRVRRADVEGIE